MARIVALVNFDLSDKKSGVVWDWGTRGRKFSRDNLVSLLVSLLLLGLKCWVLCHNRQFTFNYNIATRKLT